MTDPIDPTDAILRVGRTLAGKTEPELEEFLEDVRVLFLLLSDAGVRRIAIERRRQITDEGYTAEHDAGHSPDLFQAGVCYGGAAYLIQRDPSPSDAMFEELRLTLPPYWPWAPEFWKPSPDPIRNAEKAGALLAAGIESLLAEQNTTKGNTTNG